MYLFAFSSDHCDCQPVKPVTWAGRDECHGFVIKRQKIHYKRLPAPQIYRECQVRALICEGMRGWGLIFQFWPFVRLIGWSGRIIRPTTAVLASTVLPLIAMYMGVFQIYNTSITEGEHVL